MKRIFFDARYIRVDHHDGISRYSVGLFHSLSEHVALVAIISDLRQLTLLPKGTEYVTLHAPTSPLEPFSALLLNRHRPDVVFSPMQTIGSLGRKFKLVLTLHDLIYYRHPKAPPSLSLPVRLAWRLYHLSFWPARLMLNASDAVVTVSQTTREAIQQHRLTRKPVRVVYNAAGSSETPPVSARKLNSVNTKSLLYMGSFMPYKNVDFLVKAMSQLPDFELHLLSPIAKARRLQLEALCLSSNVVFHDGVSEQAYEQMLNQAFALVSASLDEGFGIPLVEAMAKSTPVVVSDIPIFREVAGNAGLFFDPRSPEDFANLIRSLDESGIWAAASTKSLERSRAFSWHESATQLLKTLEELD